MKQNVSPVTAAIIVVVIVAVVALAGYKFFVGGSKSASSASQQTKMQDAMKTYGQGTNQREEADRRRGAVGGGMPQMPR